MLAIISAEMSNSTRLKRKKIRPEGHVIYKGKTIELAVVFSTTFYASIQLYGK